MLIFSLFLPPAQAALVESTSVKGPPWYYWCLPRPRAFVHNAHSPQNQINFLHKQPRQIIFFFLCQNPPKACLAQRPDRHAAHRTHAAPNQTPHTEKQHAQAALWLRDCGGTRGNVGKSDGAKSALAFPISLTSVSCSHESWWFAFQSGSSTPAQSSSLFRLETDKHITRGSRSRPTATSGSRPWLFISAKRPTPG